MNKKAGICRQFGYYTSGNTEEYENECGAIDKLDHTVQTLPCVTETTYTVESCDCFEEKAADKVVDTTQTTNIATNAAAIASAHP